MHKIAESIALKFLQNNTIDLNKEIAKVASEQRLNPFEIDRIINHANKKVILGIQKNINAGVDPHFTFPRAERGKILQIVRSSTCDSPAEKTVVISEPKESIMSPFFSKNDILNSDGNLESASDRAMFLEALRIKVEQAKSKIFRIEMMINELKSKFEKQAFQMIANGHPIEPIQEMDDIFGVTEGIINHMNNNLIKVASIGDRDFDINPNHPLASLYIDMHKLRLEEECIKKEASEINDQFLSYKKRMK